VCCSELCCAVVTKSKSCSVLQLQCVAVCCCVSLCVEVCGSMLQCVVLCCGDQG